jgi:putative alpha-1,2-mannosidase
MTTTIAGIILDRDMIFENEFNHSQIRVEVTPTLGGGVVIQEFQATEKGRLITLVSTESQGMQKKSTVQSLKDLSQIANQTYPLVISSNSKTFTKTVRFSNEVQGGAVQFSPFQDRQGLHSDDIWYKGTIYMMVV